MANLREHLQYINKTGIGIKKSFTRETRKEIEDIIAQLRVLGIVENNIETIAIDKNTDKITLTQKEQTSNSKALNKDILVKDYVEYYLFTYRKNGINGRKIEDTTFATYTEKGELIKKGIGDKKVAELTYEDLDEFINDLHKNTCDTTARQTRDILTSMLEFAYKDGITTENVLLNKKITLKESKGKTEKKTIQADDIGVFTDCCRKHKYYDLLLVLNTGMRASELAGLTWDNLDFENKTVKIEKAYMRVKKQEYKNGKVIVKRVKEFKDLKSKDSYRTIGIQNKEMWNMLKQHKEEQKELAKRCNKTFKKTDWVFTTKTYKGYVADYLGDKFRKVMNEIKIQNYKQLTVHDLRHTYCTLGIMGGVEVEKMKEILGHSNIAVTVNWYMHLDKQTIINASNKVTKVMEQLARQN